MQIDNYKMIKDDYEAKQNEKEVSGVFCSVGEGREAL